MNCGGRSQADAGATPSETSQQSVGAGKAGGVLRRGVENFAETLGDRKVEARTDRCSPAQGNVSERVRSYQGVGVDYGKSGEPVKRPAKTALFRPYCDSVVSRSQNSATEDSNQNEHEGRNDSRSERKRPDSPRRSEKGKSSRYH